MMSELVEGATRKAVVMGSKSYQPCSWRVFKNA
jgi:hypothetical protein